MSEASTRLWLTLFVDKLLPGSVAGPLEAGQRVVYVAAGTVRVDDDLVGEDDARFATGQTRLAAVGGEAEAWRWELSDSRPDVPAFGAAGETDRKLAVPLTTLDAEGDLLVRCDSVSFPPGGRAYFHTHRGPGIRCLKEGAITISTKGKDTAHEPGDAWFESGPEPVFARADDSEATRFIRVMVLPAELLGKSSIEYVREEDRDKPKTQSYKIYVDQRLPA